MPHSFNRVGNAPRVGQQAGEHSARGPLGTRLNDRPTASGIRGSLGQAAEDIYV